MRLSASPRVASSRSARAPIGSGGSAYNPADAVSQFDRLYRRQLLTLYRRLNLPPPGELALSLATGHGMPEYGGVMRRANA